MGAVLSKYMCCLCNTGNTTCYPCQMNKQVKPECEIVVKECFLEIANI